MEEYVKLKRRNGSIYDWPSKLYIPVPSAVKKQFSADSRMYRMSQAELGAVIVMHYLMNMHLSAAAVAEYKRTKEKERTEYLESLSKKEVDRTFGGKFKSSFPGEEDEET